MIVECAWCGVELGGERVHSDPGAPRSHGICASCAVAVANEDGLPVEEFLDRLSAPVIVVGGNAEVRTVNEAGEALLGVRASDAIDMLAGEVFECVNARLPGGCGATVHCSGCALRRAVEHTHRTGESSVRTPATLKVRDPNEPVRVDMYLTTAKVGEQVVVRIDAADQEDAGSG